MKILKNLLLLIFILLGFVCGICAGDTGSNADVLYRDGDFEKAKSLYMLLAEQNPQNPYYNYNLANCYYKTGKMGKAVLYYLRAFNLLPRDKNIRENLSMVLSINGENLVPRGVPHILHKMYFYFSIYELKGFFWLFFWVWAILMAAYLIYFNGKRFLKQLLVVTALFAGFFGLWAGTRHLSRAENLAVITAFSADIKSGPADSFNLLATIGEGNLVFITTQKDSWYGIIVKENALKGWIKKDSLEKVGVSH
jgi:tetratricopeptide (TPR) repeat protein